MALPSLQKLDKRVSVAAQLSVDDVQALAAAGFKSIINNRPDFEGGPDQPTAQAIAAAAAAMGLVCVHQPVSPSVQTAQDLARFAQLVAELPPPIVAFCRSGTRSGKLYKGAFGG